MKPGARGLFAVAFALPLAAVGAALFTQHVLGMLPCPWCVLQRLIFVAIALAALPGLLAPARVVRGLSAAGVGLLALAGMAAALWQHFVASSSTSCAQTLAGRIVGELGLDESLPEVFAAYASCADAKATLLGLPYEFFSLSLFALLAFVALRLLRLLRGHGG